MRRAGLRFARQQPTFLLLRAIQQLILASPPWPLCGLGASRSCDRGGSYRMARSPESPALITRDKARTQAVVTPVCVKAAVRSSPYAPLLMANDPSFAILISVLEECESWYSRTSQTVVRRTDRFCSWTQTRSGAVTVTSLWHTKNFCEHTVQPQVFAKIPAVPRVVQHRRTIIMAVRRSTARRDARI
jgi:hypothetical protein